MKNQKTKKYFIAFVLILFTMVNMDAQAATVSTKLTSKDVVTTKEDIIERHQNSGLIYRPLIEVKKSNITSTSFSRTDSRASRSREFVEIKVILLKTGEVIETENVYLGTYGSEVDNPLCTSADLWFYDLRWMGDEGSQFFVLNICSREGKSFNGLSVRDRSFEAAHEAYKTNQVAREYYRTHGQYAQTNMNSACSSGNTVDEGDSFSGPTFVLDGCVYQCPDSDPNNDVGDHENEGNHVEDTADSGFYACVADQMATNTNSSCRGINALYEDCIANGGLEQQCKDSAVNTAASNAGGGVSFSGFARSCIENHIEAKEDALAACRGAISPDSFFGGC